MFGGDPTSCPMMGGTANAKGPHVEYNGVSYAFCCGGCDARFAKDPATALKNPSLKGKVTGTFLFDPVSGQRINTSEAKLSSVYNGTRFYFSNEADQKAFNADMKKYGTLPAKEVMQCPVSGEKVDNYSGSVGFADYNGVRYYFCCADCIAPFKGSPAKYAAEASKKAAAPKAIKEEAGK